jgi:triacylglycerol lipase
MVTLVAPKVQPSIHKHDFPLVGEFLAIPEYLVLRTAPVYWGWGIARGHGEPIINAPGFLGPDISMGTLFAWEHRMGYRPYFSGLGVNDDCPEDSEGTMTETTRRAVRESHKAAVLIGHSWGGTLAERTARQIPEGVVRLVITLASPMNANLRINPLLDRAREFNRQRVLSKPRLHEECYTADCGCPFIRSIAKQGPKGFRLVNIVARGDPVVHEEDTVHPQADRVEEVSGTHTGLPWNAEVYKIIAEELAM